MFTILPDFEQLEQAGEFLDKASPAFARLSLILTDNLVELLMYRRVCHEFAKDEAYSGVRPPLYSPKKRRDVLENFNDKVNFLESPIAVIDAESAKFLKFAHDVRNEAYHKEAYHSDVIIPIARTHLGAVYRLYPHIRFPDVVFADSASEREFLARHEVAGAADLLDGDLERICQASASKRQCETSVLTQAVSRNLVRRIDGILGTDEDIGLLETLLDRSPVNQADKDEMLKHIQFVNCYTVSV